MEIQIILVGIELELLQGSPGRKYVEMAGLSVTWIVLDSLQVTGGQLDSTGQFTGSWRKTGQFRTVQIYLEVNLIVQNSLQEAGGQLDSTGQFTGSWRSTIYSRRFIDSWRSIRELIGQFKVTQRPSGEYMTVAGGELDNTVQFTGSWRSTR